MVSLNAARKSILGESLTSFAIRAGRYATRKLRRRVLSQQHNTSIHPSVWIERGVKLGLNGDINIAEQCRLRTSSMVIPLGGHVNIGANSGVGPFTILYGQGGLDIGENVLFAAHTVVIPANHRFDDVSTPIRQQGATKKGVTINDDVWVGANCTILDDVEIRTGAVVAAGSVVTESVPEYSIVAGTPAKVVGTRGD